MRLALLKAKIKALAEEARILRRLEQKYPKGSEAARELYIERVVEIREWSRAVQLAYAFLRGRKYEAVERDATKEPQWTKAYIIALEHVDQVAPDSMEDVKERYSYWVEGARKRLVENRKKKLKQLEEAQPPEPEGVAS